MTYSICLYHIIWATKGRQQLLRGPVEASAFAAIRPKSTELDCPIHAVNGWLDHVHVAVTIKPAFSVADWVAKVKGVSSRSVNETFPQLGFAWQAGYGVLTFGQKQLLFVLKYIANQKTHHQQTTTWDGLERWDD